MSSLDFANRVVERCSSTNDLARQLGEAGFPHGTWVSAREQNAGRGRQGRGWASLEGNLFLSVLARVEPLARWPWIPIATGVAVARALRARHPGLDLKVKWPNDLWSSENRKLGGILCEGVAPGRSTQSGFVIIGVGINCACAPSLPDTPTTSLSAEVGAAVFADDVRDLVTSAVSSTIKQLESDGPEAILAEFSVLTALSPGTTVQWGAGREGRVLGLGPSGELRVLDRNGSETSLLAEDVRIRPSFQP